MLFLELRLNRLDSLNTDSEQAIEIFPTNPIFYYLNGLSFYYKKNYEKTIEPIKTGVNFVVSNPNLSSEMYSILGNSYNELKDFENSDISYERALEYIPDNVQVLNNYAYYLSLREENLERAEKMSKKTIEIFPGIVKRLFVFFICDLSILFLIFLKIQNYVQRLNILKIDYF